MPGHVDDLNPSVRRRIFYRSNQRPCYLVEGDKAESLWRSPRPGDELSNLVQGNFNSNGHRWPGPSTYHGRITCRGKTSVFDHPFPAARTARYAHDRRRLRRRLHKPVGRSLRASPPLTAARIETKSICSNCFAFDGFGYGVPTK